MSRTPTGPRGTLPGEARHEPGSDLAPARSARWAAGSERAWLIAVLLLPAVPLFHLGGSLMTVDTPLVCCWTWAAVWAYRGIARDDPRAWVTAGAFGALGMLTKATMLAFPASVGV